MTECGSPRSGLGVCRCPNLLQHKQPSWPRHHRSIRLPGEPAWLRLASALSRERVSLELARSAAETEEPPPPCSEELFLQYIPPNREIFARCSKQARYALRPPAVLRAVIETVQDALASYRCRRLSFPYRLPCNIRISCQI